MERFIEIIKYVIRHRNYMIRLKVAMFTIWISLLMAYSLSYIVYIEKDSIMIQGGNGDNDEKVAVIASVIVMAFFVVVNTILYVRKQCSQNSLIKIILDSKETDTLKKEIIDKILQ